MFKIGDTNEQFAKLLRATPSTVCAWEDGSKELDYDALKAISLLLHLSLDFVKGTGIFSEWDQIFEYYDAVSSQLQALIPRGVLRFAGSDGFWAERIVPKSREQVIKEFLDSLEHPDDENI